MWYRIQRGYDHAFEKALNRFYDATLCSYFLISAISDPANQVHLRVVLTTNGPEIAELVEPTIVDLFRTLDVERTTPLTVVPPT